MAPIDLSVDTTGVYGPIDMWDIWESVKFNATMSVYKCRELRTLKNGKKIRLKMSIDIFTNVYKYLYTFTNS